MKPDCPSAGYRIPARCFLLAASLVMAGPASAQLTWDANGSTVNAQDGSGTWLDAGRWHDGIDGSNSVDWVSGSDAIFGVGGTAGTVSLVGGVSAGNLTFNALAVSGAATPIALSAYAFESGTLTLATGSTIQLNNNSSATTNASTRLRFLSTAVIAGNNIKINSTGSNGGLINLAGANSWTGDLTLSGTGGGLFAEFTNINALTTLDKIIVGSGASLILNYTPVVSAPNLNKPIEITGNGSGSRGSIRFDKNITLDGTVELKAASRVNVLTGFTGTFNGVVSGNFTLTMDSNVTTYGGLVFTKNNTFGALMVSKGNAQIGVAGVGTSGNGRVTVNGATSVVSGTGQIKAGLTVTNGSVRPGDLLGVSTGTLSVAGGVIFDPASSMTVGQFTLDSPSAVSDRLNITTGGLSLNANSNFSVALASGYTPTLGHSWHIIDWEGTLNNTGFNPATNVILQDISSSGYTWDVALNAQSLVATIVIPEPGHAILAAFGMMSLFGVRKRSV